MRATLTIERLSKLGDGAAALEGRTVFVEGALPGETVVAEVEPAGKILRGTIAELLVRSPARREPSCPIASECGGCDWLHASEEAQRDAKKEIVLSALEHLGGIARGDLGIEQTGISPSAMGYRRRAGFHFAKRRLAYFGRRSQLLVEIGRCPALVPRLAELPGKLSEALGPLANDAHQLRLVAEGDEVAFALSFQGPVSRRRKEQCGELVRKLGLSGAVLVPEEGSPQTVGRPALRSLSLLTPQVPLYLRPDVFAQANGLANPALVASVVQAVGATEADRVLELYCGSGNLTFALAGTAKEVLAIETAGAAVELAQRSAGEGGVKNVRFVQGDVAKVCRGLVSEASAFDLVVADPPRAGAPGLGGWAKKLNARKVVYVACDPASLARDGAELAASGFRPRGLQLVDMFPQTRHIEAVMRFEAP